MIRRLTVRSIDNVVFIVAVVIHLANLALRVLQLLVGRNG